MVKRLIVALCGQKMSGKDVCASHLVATAGFAHMKFATPLKRACAHLFDLSDDQVHGSTKDVRDGRWNKSPREILQFVGTEMFQMKLQDLLPDMGRTFWAKTLAQKIETSSDDRIVISDMRFQHELDTLSGISDSVVVALRIERPALACTDTHASETELNDIAPVALLRNDADVRTLCERLDDILRVCKGK